MADTPIGADNALNLAEQTDNGNRRGGVERALAAYRRALSMPAGPAQTRTRFQALMDLAEARCVGGG